MIEIEKLVETVRRCFGDLQGKTPVAIKASPKLLGSANQFVSAWQGLVDRSENPYQLVSGIDQRDLTYVLTMSKRATDSGGKAK